MDILAALKKEQTDLQQRLNGLQIAIAALNGEKKTVLGPRGRGWKRVVSAAARAKMSKAAKEHWAKIKTREKGKKSGYPAVLPKEIGVGPMRACVHSLPDAFAVEVRLNRYGLRPDRASLLRSHSALCDYGITSETLRFYSELLGAYAVSDKECGWKDGDRGG
jgi:hypothetical protein